MDQQNVYEKATRRELANTKVSLMTFVAFPSHQSKVEILHDGSGNRRSFSFTLRSEQKKAC